MEFGIKELIIVGASGNMGLLILKRAALSGHEIAAAIVGPEDNTDHVHDCDEAIIDCEKINQFDWNSLINEYRGKALPIIIDATSEKIVNHNWETYYKKLGFPVIFITTGVNEESLIGHKSPILLASPNCCLALVNVLKKFANLDHEKLKINGPDEKIYYGITESHQGPDISKGLLGKKNVSSTAKAIDSLLSAGGLEILYFESIRDSKKQLNMGILSEDLAGHAWHEYHFMFEKKSKASNYLEEVLLSLMSDLPKYGDFTHTSKPGLIRRVNEDESLEFILRYDENNFCFSHNVNGRAPYIDGLFSENVFDEFVKLISEKRNEIYTMYDLI